MTHHYKQILTVVIIEYCLELVGGAISPLGKLEDSKAFWLGNHKKPVPGQFT